MRAADVVADSIGHSFGRDSSTLYPLLKSWRKQADRFLAEEQQALLLLQRDLHALKRRTPGRKVRSLPPPGELKALWRDRVDRPPTIARSLPIHRSTAATRWHCRDLGSTLGAVNRGVHVLVGTDEAGVIVDRTVPKTVLIENIWDRCGDMPREHATHSVLSTLPDARFVLKVEQ